MIRLIEFAAKLGLTLQVFKTALAAAAAWITATQLSGSYPYFAPLAAILTVQVTVAHSLKAAVQRFGGIVVGVIISMLVGHWLKIGTLAIFIMTLAGMTISTGLHLPTQISSQIGMTSLLVLAIGQGHGSTYAVSRIVETLIGSVVAILINALIIPPNAVPAAKKQMLRLSEQSGETLKTLTLLLDGPEIQSEDNIPVDKLITETGKGISAVRLAEDSLRYSPLTFDSQQQLEMLAAGMQRLEYVTIQIRGIRKGLLDLAPRAASLPVYDNLKSAIRATAHCLPCYGQRIVDPAPQNRECFARAVSLAYETHRTCLLDLRNVAQPELLRDLGAILTDLNRIVAGVAEQS